MKPVEFLSRLYSLAPILWKDRDWDYQYLLVLLDWKLARMQKCLKEDEIVLGSKLRAEEIAEARKRLDLMLKDEWDLEVTEKMEQRFGKYRTYTERSDSDMIRVVGIYDSKPSPTVQKKHFLKVIDEVSTKEYNNRAEFFAILCDKMQGWWT
jgi:hypothetical protein